jgi:hypothetical protein
MALFMNVLGPTLALREFVVNPDAPDGLYVRVVGRPAGFMGWLLSVLGLLDDTVMVVNADDVRVVSASLSGKTQTVMPLKKIASSACGYTSNLGFIVTAVIALLGGLIGSLKDGEIAPFLGGLIVAAIFALFFWFSKRLIMTVESAGGLVVGMKFKHGIIQGTRVDFAQAQTAIDLLCLKIAASNT